MRRFARRVRLLAAFVLLAATVAVTVRRRFAPVAGDCGCDPV